MAKAAADYVLPELYNFPPFFTLQPVDVTRVKQIEEWCHLIISWHESNGKTTMSVKEWELWDNKSINRRLGEEGIVAVISKLIESGNAAWEDDTHTRLKIFYTSLGDWATAIHDYVLKNNMATESNVYTLYELRTDRLYSDAVFHDLDPFIFAKALEQLAKAGLCTLTPGEDIDQLGVTFIGRR